ncbi:bifunctional metallophosphatase/5'-nucleotidase [Longimicrobium sp.]|uniref:bifunctional metallophosphatase/5'-nucleotidase n=1 Tax=Longimicrobium sp. TaxID=2029185 RepID=UPI002E2F8FA0|nr:5'-nucleotidase C-terminal domain-containing protein [Longimicrobium sp.]HEX6037384.1 5'-nucleotidase C-terminal domain-containing protein [Longimicrobium sp.]
MNAFRRLTATLPVAAGLAALGGCAPRTPPAQPAPVEGRLVLMGTTDLHGWILPYDYYTGQRTNNGLATLVSLIDSVRAANPARTVLVESGDLLQGNPMDFVYRRLAEGETHPLIQAMNLVGYDAAAIGNHEFNYGIEHLARSTADASFPFLSANVFRAGTDEHAYRPYTFVERTVGGHTVKIGITSVTPPGVMIWDRDNVQGRLEFRDIVASVRPVVARMRAEGADVVLVAAHSGLEGSSYDTAATGVPTENAASAMAREVPGIDVIFMGHTHREVTDTTINGVQVQQAKNWGTSLAVAELDLRWADGRWTIADASGTVLHPREGSTSPRLESALAQAHERTRAYVSQVVGTSTETWSSATARTRDTPILDLINDVQMRVTGADLSSTAAFSLTSRLPAGNVTVADVAGLYVYDNTLKAVRISGAQLRAYLEKSAEYYLPCPGGACESLVNPSVAGYNFDVVSGVDYTLDVSRPVGQRVVRLERDGRAVAATDSFTLALNNYRASGSGGFSMLIGAPVVYDRGEGIRELLIEDIRRRGTLRPGDVFRHNWDIVPAALAERAQAEQRPPAQPGGEAHGGSTGQRPRTP